MNLTATYSPEDNKLRLYADSRLEPEIYEQVKAAGFIWAPRQKLFVAPKWSPGREDLLIELCGEIGDEDKSLVERAEERAERFDNYSERRAADAEGAKNAVTKIADGIPFGQPILVGHHSERRARKDAEKIETGMRRAVKMWEQAKYWEQRAAGAIHHAKYKESPAVRARRIKGIEADWRRVSRERSELIYKLKLWNALDTPEKFKIRDGENGETRKDFPTREELALHIADRASFNLPADEKGRRWTAWDVLRPDGERYTECPAYTIEQVQESARELFPRSIARRDRWLAHYTNRILYERAMQAESGGTAADKTKPEKGGAVKCWAGRGAWMEINKVNRVSVTVTDSHDNTFNRESREFFRNIPFDKLTAVISKADYQAMKAGAPAPSQPAPAPVSIPDRSEDPEIRAMKETLKLGVKIVSAPQLFPTPGELAARMVALAEIEPGMTVLEPSAGSGNIVAEIIEAVDTEIFALEINPELCTHLSRTFPSYRLQARCRDFLQFDEFRGKWQRIVMNPPFIKGADIDHILHAAELLAPGGRLVALCANGPRQEKKLRPLVEANGGTWERLPAGTFKAAGTGVNTVLLAFTNRA